MDQGTPGRSLLAEMTELREQMEALRTAMGLLVDLQRELNVNVTSALESQPLIVMSSQVA
jgi:hypothetical protein